jgi:hypothetical protein
VLGDPADRSCVPPFHGIWLQILGIRQLSSWNSPTGVALYPNGTFRLCLLTEMPLRLVTPRWLEASSMSKCSTDSPGQPREITQSPPFQPITVSNGCLNFNRVFENSDWRYAMLAIQTLTREVGGNAALRPACPNCGRSMHMTRITHGTAGLPDQLTFRCGECGVWLTEAAGDQSGHAH